LRPIRAGAGSFRNRRGRSRSTTISAPAATPKATHRQCLIEPEIYNLQSICNLKSAI
jgi:hypothetical protein